MQTFSAAAVREIVGVSQRCLDYWDERDIVKPSGECARGKGSERSYSFDDLVRLTLVKELRTAGISLQKIRKALKKLRKRWPARDPLLDEVIVTDGVSLYTRGTRGRLEDILAGGQLILSIIAVGEIREGVRQKVLRFDQGVVRTRGSQQRRRIAR